MGAGTVCIQTKYVDCVHALRMSLLASTFSSSGRPRLRHASPTPLRACHTTRPHVHVDDAATSQVTLHSTFSCRASAAAMATEQEDVRGSAQPVCTAHTLPLACLSCIWASTHLTD